MKSWNEIRRDATKFAHRWKGAYDEKSQAQSFLKGEAKGQSLLIQVRQAKLGRTNSGRSYIVKKSTYD